MSKDLFALNQTPIGKKPAGRLEIDWNHPYANNNLVMAVIDGYDLVQDYKSADHKRTVNDGIVWQMANSALRDVNPIYQQNFRMLFKARVTEVSANNSAFVFIGHWTSAVDNSGIFIQRRNDGTLGIVQYNDNEGYVLHTEQALNEGDIVEVKLSSFYATSKIYMTYRVNGGNWVSTYDNTLFYTRKDLQPIKISVGRVNSGQNLEVEYCYTYTTIDDYDAVTALSLDPYQFIKPASSLQDSVYAALYPIPTATATTGLLQVDTLNGLFALNQTPKGKKPAGDYVIDWSNTLSDGLIGYIDFNYKNVINKVNNTFAATTNTFAPAISNLNTCRQSLYNTTGSKASFDANDIPISNSAITIHIVLSAQQAWLDTHQTPETIIDTTIGNTEGFRLFKRTGVTVGGQVWRFRIFLGGTGYNVDVNCVEWHEGDLVQLTWIYDGSLVKIYQDGVELISEAHSGTINPIVDGWWFAQNAVGVDLNGGIFYYHSSHIYNKALTQKQINALNSDPYQILKPASSLQDSVYAALQSSSNPIAVDDYYTATSGTQLVVPAVTGILLNDTYTA